MQNRGCADGGRRALNRQHKGPSHSERCVVGGSLEDGGRGMAFDFTGGPAEEEGGAGGAEGAAVHRPGPDSAPALNNFWFIQSTSPNIWLHAHRWEMVELQSFMFGQETTRRIRHGPYEALLQRVKAQRPDVEVDRIFMYDRMDPGYADKMKEWQEHKTGPQPQLTFTIVQRECKFILPDVQYSNEVMHRASDISRGDWIMGIVRTVYHGGAKPVQLTSQELFEKDGRPNIKPDFMTADFSLLFRDERNCSDYVKIDTRNEWYATYNSDGHVEAKDGHINHWIIQSRTRNVWLHAHHWETLLMNYLQDLEPMFCWGEFPKALAKRYRGCIVKRGTTREAETMQMYDLDYRHLHSIIQRDCRVIALPVHKGAMYAGDVEEALPVDDFRRMGWTDGSGGARSLWPAIQTSIFM